MDEINEMIIKLMIIRFNRLEEEFFNFKEKFKEVKTRLEEEAKEIIEEVKCTNCDWSNKSYKLIKYCLPYNHKIWTCPECGKQNKMPEDKSNVFYLLNKL